MEGGSDTVGAGVDPVPSPPLGSGETEDSPPVGAGVRVVGELETDGV